MDKETFDLFLGVMSLIALFVFIALYFIKAGYGMFRTSSWGFSINNKLAWMLMEAPLFACAADLLPAVSAALLPALVHISSADEGQEPDADCYHVDGRTVQSAEWFHAG